MPFGFGSINAIVCHVGDVDGSGHPGRVTRHGGGSKAPLGSPARTSAAGPSVLDNTLASYIVLIVGGLPCSPHNAIVQRFRAL